MLLRLNQHSDISPTDLHSIINTCFNQLLGMQKTLLGDQRLHLKTLILRLVPLLALNFPQDCTSDLLFTENISLLG